METWIVVVIVFIIIFIVITIENRRKNAKWRKALKLDPASAYYDRAHETYYDKEGKSHEERIEDAIDDLTMAIALDPEYADAYHSRGALYDDCGKKKEALADYKMFLKLSDYKTDLEMLKEYQKHKNLVDSPVYEPLADPLVVARLSNKTLRDMARKRVRELESYGGKEGSQK
jgi:tetratricopeptide (TPR) repeat protein